MRSQAARRLAILLALCFAYGCAPIPWSARDDRAAVGEPPWVARLVAPDELRGLLHGFLEAHRECRLPLEVRERVTRGGDQRGMAPPEEGWCLGELEISEWRLGTEHHVLVVVAPLRSPSRLLLVQLVWTGEEWLIYWPEDLPVDRGPG